MQAKDFAVMISNLGFSPLDVAQLWGTAEDRVVEWMHGEKEIPFAMWWILLPLRDERVFSTVQQIVETSESNSPIIRGYPYAAATARSYEIDAQRCLRLSRSRDQL
jgi:hypothetical protein